MTREEDRLKAACHVVAVNWPLSGEQVLRLYTQVAELVNGYTIDQNGNKGWLVRDGSYCDL